MTRICKQLVAGLFLTFALISTLAAAQDAASGLDPALLAKANSGDAASQFQVAVEYQKGDLVPRDFVQAEMWYRKAAELGDARAQYNLGLLYLQKQSGIMKDEAQAVTWLRKAADQGNSGAQASLALCYSQGHGVLRDDAQALAWYQKAVAQNNTDAMVNLALLYARGQGVPKDDRQAFDLTSKAAELGAANAQYQLGMDYDLGQGIKKDKNQAMAWYRKSDEQGNSWAQYNLGQLLGSNHAEAYFWLSLAVNHLVDTQALEKATELRDAAAAKLKAAEKADADQRIDQWHATPATHP